MNLRNESAIEKYDYELNCYAKSSYPPQNCSCKTHSADVEEYGACIQCSVRYVLDKYGKKHLARRHVKC
jgi:hypothetical protein